MNRGDFLRGLVRTAIATALLPGLPRRNREGNERFAFFDCNPRYFGDPDHANDPVEITTFTNVALDDDWTECVHIGSVSLDNGKLVRAVELDLAKLRGHVTVLDSTGGKWHIIGDFEGLRGPGGEIVL